MQGNVFCGRFKGISGVLRPYVVECVYFRIKLNTLGHGLGLNKKTKQQAPREWREVPGSAGISGASHRAVYTGRGEPAPCRNRVVLLGSVTGEGRQGLPSCNWRLSCLCIRFHSLSSNWVHTPVLAGRLRRCTPASRLHGIDFDVPSFLRLPAVPWKAPWPRREAIPPLPFPPPKCPFASFTKDKHTLYRILSLTMMCYSRAHERVPNLKHYCRGTCAEMFEDC